MELRGIETPDPSMRTRSLLSCRHCSPMALLLGDLPRVEQVELDSAGNSGDAGLAGLAGGEVATGRQ
jgi:hypothetical protein